jgi:excinuclease ABC subunit B
VEYGFRLPSALDNRPLKFEEFLERVGQTIYTSATPAEWEINKAQSAKRRVQNLVKSSELMNHSGVVEQLIRPTGLLDPEIEIRRTEGQIENLISEIERREERGERILVTTLTKRMAEELSTFLEEKGIKVHYLHADVETLKRTEILEDLRRGKYDVVVGINLLREGLDLPEVSLVAILDADKEGFLRSETSLIQVMGRAARHVRGKVIMYADNVTGSMRRAIAEVDRRREVQLAYNREHGIKPQSIVKPIRERLVDSEVAATHASLVTDEEIEAMPPTERQKLVDDLELKMTEAARDLDFEQAADLRDQIIKIKKTLR